MADKSPLQVMTEAGLTPDMIRALDPLQAAYGWAAAFNDIPELKGILDQAVAGQWTDDVLAAAIQNSEWAKQKRQAQVQYEINRRLHPADVAGQRKALEQNLQQMAVGLGMTLTPDRLQVMSGWALKNGYTDEEIKRMVLSEYHYDPKALAQGQTATTLDSLKQQARAYMVPVSDAALGMWVDALIKEQQDPASFTEWLRQQAKGMFPPLAGQIDGGMDTKTLLDPYKNVLESELGLADVDMADMKYMGQLMQVDPSSGSRTMPNLDQWRTMIRTNPAYGWGKTVNAQEMSVDLGARLAEEMGARR